jgi:hypothetical protein
MQLGSWAMGLMDNGRAWEEVRGSPRLSPGLKAVRVAADEAVATHLAG